MFQVYIRPDLLKINRIGRADFLAPPAVKDFERRELTREVEEIFGSAGRKIARLCDGRGPAIRVKGTNG